MENPLEIQVGGAHYKSLAMQPIELIVALGCSFIQGNIIKYISRYKAKNGKQDIEKCIHYAKLAIQLNDRKRCKNESISYFVNRYVVKNKLSLQQRVIITQAVYNKYDKVIQYCEELISKEY